MKKTLLILLLSPLALCFSQNMQEGFGYLETGKFKEAESFFTQILKNYPDNKTARLCYARAIGLQDRPEKARDIFNTLLSEFPNDFEIKLNYAESLLWNKDFLKAKRYYQKLLEEEPENFVANLGYANTLSNLKDYEPALLTIKKALNISPNNPGTLNSQKYIHLGYADQLMKRQQYAKAEALLKENLLLFRGDSETLKSLANLYIIQEQFEKATSTYKELKEQPSQEISALNGLSLVSHLKQQDKKALGIAEMAYTKSATSNSEADKRSSIERYTQALIWNRKYDKAREILAIIDQSYVDQEWIRSLKATYAIYRSDFKESLQEYQSILNANTASFDGNLGKANAHKGLKQFDQAYIAAQKTLDYHPNQKDAKFFIETLNLSFAPSTTINPYYSIDNADNEAYAITGKIAIPLSTKLSINSSYAHRTAENKNTSDRSSSDQFSMGLNYRFNSSIEIKSTFGLSSVDAQGTSFDQFITDISAAIIPSKLQNLEIGYQRRIQDFNVELLGRNLVLNNFYANYNLATYANLGWYVQYFHTRQSDDNNQNVLFTSLYYTLSNTPVIKGGINYQYLSFSEQRPTIYFSPEQYHAIEVFVNLFKSDEALKSKKWFYNITGATGIQFIEDQDGQSTYRIQAQIGYKLRRDLLVNIDALRSNIAAATAAGFTYNQVGLSLKWYIDTKPWFQYKKG